jgi:hypothetical protein
VFGLTVSLNMFNLTGGPGLFDRTVWNGYRDRSRSRSSRAAARHLDDLFSRSFPQTFNHLFYFYFIFHIYPSPK